jgi:hypothetical protein
MTYGITEVIAQLAEVIEDDEDKGEHGANCYYSNLGEEGLDPSYAEGEDVYPICIVGQVVYRAEGREGLLKLKEDISLVPIELERSQEAEEKGYGINNMVLRELGYTDEAIEVLNAAQFKQDGGGFWTEAFILAQEKAAELSVQ